MMQNKLDTVSTFTVTFHLFSFETEQIIVCYKKKNHITNRLALYDFLMMEHVKEQLYLLPTDCRH